jgi:hypothetical protein
LDEDRRGFVIDVIWAIIGTKINLAFEIQSALRPHNPMSEKTPLPRKRSNAPQRLHELALSSLDPLTRQRGFAGAELIARWPAFVGDHLARHCRPLALRWPVRGEKAVPGAVERGATLDIAVSGAYALDLQHSEAMLIEQINGLFGWRCVERIRLLQRPFAQETPSEPPAPPLTQAERAALDERLRKIDDPGLREAMFRLGDGVIRRLKRNQTRRDVAPLEK